MSLDPMPDTATLLRMKEEREGRSRSATFGVPRSAFQTQAVETTAGAGYTTVTLAVWEGTQPIRLRIPWSCLVSDNALYLTRNGKRFKTPEYREAQKRIRALATDVMAGRPPADCPLSITFRFYVPNGQHRDVHNFIAGLADSLKGVVFADDHWLHQGGWTHCGKDIDSPRAEVTISPLSPPQRSTPE